MRGRASLRACSSLAASKRWKEAATTSRNDSRNSGATLACLCSSDKVYAREAADAAKALTAAGAKHIYLAGKPGADRAALEGAGIRTFLHQGCDTLAILNAAYDEI